MGQAEPVQLAFLSTFYNDYTNEASRLRSAAEHGAYKLLLDHYGQYGFLPTEDRELARIAYCSPKEWAKIREAVAPLFNPDWTHSRLDRERTKAIARFKVKSKAGRGGGIASGYARQSGALQPVTTTVAGSKNEAALSTKSLGTNYSFPYQEREESVDRYTLRAMQVQGNVIPLCRDKSDDAVMDGAVAC